MNHPCDIIIINMIEVYRTHSLIAKIYDFINCDACLSHNVDDSIIILYALAPKIKPLAAAMAESSILDENKYLFVFP
jgi:hypothetical protein